MPIREVCSPVNKPGGPEGRPQLLPPMRRQKAGACSTPRRMDHRQAVMLGPPLRLLGQGGQVGIAVTLIPRTKPSSDER
jgi:hypothetical protein